ncbi:MAG: pilus assembly protein PilM [Aquificaceae bacterium]|nr:pilus assembly protein PilM [Aquificaceae bacterium]
MNDKVIRLVSLDSECKPMFEPIEVNIAGKNKEDVLKEIVRTYNLSGKKVCACVPVNDGLLKFQKYPSTMSKKDLESAIEWSAKREITAMREETYYDYYVMEKADDKNIGVVLVLSRKETVENIKNMLNNCGLKLHVLDYEVVSILNYGLYHKIPLPFSILYVDYNYSILATYASANISYSVTYWNFQEALLNNDEESLEGFFAEIRNIVVLNDLSSMYVAGPILTEEEMLLRVMENLPVLGLLDTEGIKPNFFIPYTLSIRGTEE